MRVIKKVFLPLILLTLLAGCVSRTTDSEQISTLDATALYSTAAFDATTAAGQTATIAAYEATGISAALTAAVTSTPIPTLARTNTPEPTTTSSIACNAAGPGTPLDVTIRDDEEMAPGESFTKIWRIQNVGSCKWTTLYQLVYFSGNPLDAIQSHYLSGEVLPGNSIDLSVDMVAPLSSGIYQSNWMLMDPDGSFFGLGPNGDAPFWVRIVVVQSVTPTQVPIVTSTPTPIVYREGVVSLLSEDMLDLDTGIANQPEGASDLLYQLQSAKFMLVPSNGAGMVLFENGVPTYNDCKEAMVGSTPIEFESINPDIYACYRTNMGLPGRLHLISFDDETDILRLEFMTWSMP